MDRSRGIAGRPPTHRRSRSPHLLLVGILWIVCGRSAISNAASPRWMVVNVPVVDVRSQPRTIAQPTAHDPEEETQLLYGERVRLRTTEAGWANVEATEQPEYTHRKKWQGYPGWVPVTSLTPWRSAFKPNIIVTEKWAPTWVDARTGTPAPWRFALGTRLKALRMTGQFWKVALLDGTTVWVSQDHVRPLGALRRLSADEKRQLILRSAMLLVGDPYYWGGRSPLAGDTQRRVTGVDCSGLVNLAYRSAGLEIPRDAHEQFLRARRTNALKPADLIFLSERSHPSHIVHVMLYAGDGDLIEGPGTGRTVRRIRVEERLGQTLDSLTPGTIVDGQTVSFGAYLP